MRSLSFFSKGFRSSLAAPRLTPTLSSRLCCSKGKAKSGRLSEFDGPIVNTLSTLTDMLGAKSGADPHFVDKLLHRNEEWCSLYAATEDDARNGFGIQAPQSTFLTCCDARVPSAAAGIEEANTVFTVRNIGNQVKNGMGSLRFGIEVLKTPYAVIMGHTGCGAVRAAAGDYRGLNTHIQNEILPLVRVMRFCESLDNYSTLEAMETNVRCDIFAEVNVDFQIDELMKDDIVVERLENKELTIIGMMFDVENAYGNGCGTLNIVNVNGDNNVENIRRLPLFDALNADDKNRFIARLFSYQK